MLSRQPLPQYPAGQQQSDTLLNVRRLLEQHSLQLRQIEHSIHKTKEDQQKAAKANEAVKVQLEELTAAARAAEAQEAGLAADVQQMRMEVAAKQDVLEASRAKVQAATEQQDSIKRDRTAQR